MKAIMALGATGAIGRRAFELISSSPDGLSRVGAFWTIRAGLHLGMDGPYP